MTTTAAGERHAVRSTAVRKTGNPVVRKPPAARRAYHHGDLRRSLLSAATAIVDADGAESLTLRNCARQAGVSHTAPRHHVGDLRGLRTALATRFWSELAEHMDRAAAAGATPRARLLDLGRTYVRYATRYPARYRLMIRQEALETADTDLIQAQQRSGQLLVSAMAGLIGRTPAPDQLVLAWAMVHGLAELIVTRQCGPTALGSGAIDRPERAIERLITLEEAVVRRPRRRT